jgi:hypothetical protein
MRLNPRVAQWAGDGLDLDVPDVALLRKREPGTPADGCDSTAGKALGSHP